MIRSSLRVALLVLVGVAFAALSLSAQVQVGQPIKVKAPKPQIVKFKGEVVSATSAVITVRSRENEKVIRTFTYSPEAREAMAKIIQRGGYQYGDKVEIHHEAGQDVAIKIEGKPSRIR